MPLMNSGSPILGFSCPTVLIGREEMLRRTNLKKSTMYTLIRKNKFPVPVRTSDGRVAWLETEVESWIWQNSALRPRKSNWEEAAIPIRSAPATTLNVASRSQPGELEDQPPKSIAQEIKKMTGRSASQLTPVVPKFHYDLETGGPLVAHHSGRFAEWWAQSERKTLTQMRVNIRVGQDSVACCRRTQRGSCSTLWIEWLARPDRISARYRRMLTPSAKKAQAKEALSKAHEAKAPLL